ncbi:rRNA maturation RNase YbeY [Methylohalobius crimeensis]|uniref:rRNA maturation RNase YbeY n=1 Tax=Methylohalobius crimeensis TaxID=244365 RepID=UPI001267D7B8|nr:rRNA maturation RNase YbeY [Methylohalobius crimeensis]
MRNGSNVWRQEIDVTACVDIQIRCDHPCPSEEKLRQWVDAALEGKSAEVSLAIVDEAEITVLNQRYRHRNRPTNVLSFPFEAPAGVPLAFLGDVVICAPVVAREAQAQGKTEAAHWAHMVVHGVLHLRGFDHIATEEAEMMESLERKILSQLGFEDPYLSIEVIERS